MVDSKCRTKGIVSLVMGILSCVSSFLGVFSFLGIIFGIIGIVFGAKAKVGANIGITKGGIVTSIVGLCVSSAATIGVLFLGTTAALLSTL